MNTSNCRALLKSTIGRVNGSSLFLLCLLGMVIFQFTLPFSAEAQEELRVFRGVNRVIFTTRKLATEERYDGDLLTLQQGERYAILSRGAGCFISKELMLTANHVVSPASSSYFIGFGGSQFPQATVLARNEKLDLALLKFTAPDRNIAFIRVPFADSKPIVEGTSIFIWAFLKVPGGFMQFLRSGIVSNNGDQELGVDHMVYVETTAIDGTSGSPVFLRDGRPLGIASSRLTVGGAQLPSGILALVPGEQVNQFLKDAGVPGY